MNMRLADYQVTCRHYEIKCTSTTQQAAPASDKRCTLEFYNTGAFVVYLRFDQPNQATTTGANGDIPIYAGNDRIYIDKVHVKSVNLIAPFGDSTVSIVEGQPLVWTKETQGS